MGKRAVLTCTAALAMSAAFAIDAVAEDFPVAYENTIVVTTSDDAQFRYFLEPDGSFSAIMPDASTISGRYAIDGDQICFTQSESEPQCSEFVDGKSVGDTWEQTGIDGAPITVSIVEGR